MAGKHNTQNVLSAIAVARELGLDVEKVRDGLNSFGGVKRRFTHVGEWNGVNIIDDYGHHPVEISAVLQAARQVVSEGRGSCRGAATSLFSPSRFVRRLFDLF